MEKQKLQTLKGFRDFLPEDASKRQYAIDIIKDTFELYGFEPLETPSLEYQEVLLGKYGEEADRMVYTFKDRGGRDVALKYDQTVPTARVLAMYHQSLPMPFRRYQIQTVWRAEKPQSGRFREFLQCDADIYGSQSPLADAETIAISNTLYKSLGFKNFKIYLNDRNILFELMNYASIPENLQLSTISAIDKLDRKSQEEVKSELIKLGLSDESTEHLFHHLDETEPTENIKKVIEYSKTFGVEEEKLLFQARLARGLDYYTSTIFEIKIDQYKAGSVLGGGRYDKLIAQLSGVDIPAVGFAVGFDRTIEAMEQLGLFPKRKTKTDVLVTVFNKELLEMSVMVISNLRENGINAELYPDETIDLKKQVKYADKKGVRWLLVIGPDEVEKDIVVLKNMQTGKQDEIPLRKLIDTIKKV